MNSKKRNKRIEHAEMVYQREQLKAAVMQEQIDKSAAIIEQYREELSEQAYDEAIAHIAERRQDVKDFIMAATEKYAKKLKELGDPKIEMN